MMADEGESVSIQIYQNPGEPRGLVFVKRGFDESVTVEALPEVGIEFDEDDGVFVAICDCFHLVGTGRTRFEAVRQLEITVRAFLSVLLQRDRLFETLSSNGWKRVDPHHTENQWVIQRLCESNAGATGSSAWKIVIQSEGVSVG
jgi:hypothetical protein